MKLTQRIIENLTCSAGKDRQVTDDDQAGLRVRIGAKARAGSLKHKTYRDPKTGWSDPCTAISLQQAREAVRAARGGYCERDPRARAAKAARKAPPELGLDEFIKNWVSLHLATLSPGYAAEAERALRCAFKPYLRGPAASLTKAIVVKTRDAMLRRGAPAMADQVVRYGFALYGWGLQREEVESNPFTGIPLLPKVRRDRILFDDELACVWHAAGREDAFGAIVRTLILTGQRRGEVAGMAEAELSPDRAVWIVPASRTKNHTAHVVPLSMPVREILQDLPPAPDELMFPGARKGKPFRGWAAAKKALDQRSAGHAPRGSRSSGFAWK